MTVAVASPALGYLLDRVEPAADYLPCLVVFGCVFASLSLLTPHLWHLYATFFIIGHRRQRHRADGLQPGAVELVRGRRGHGAGDHHVGRRDRRDGAAAAHGSVDSARRLARGVRGPGRHGPRDRTAGHGRLHPRAAVRSPRAAGRRVSLDKLGGPRSARHSRRARSGLSWPCSSFIQSLRTPRSPIWSRCSPTGASPRPGPRPRWRPWARASLVGRFITGWLLDRFFAPRVTLGLLTTAALGTLILSNAHSFATGIIASAADRASARAEKPT